MQLPRCNWSPDVENVGLEEDTGTGLLILAVTIFTVFHSAAIPLHSHYGTWVFLGNCSLYLCCLTKWVGKLWHGCWASMCVWNFQTYIRSTVEQMNLIFDPHGVLSYSMPNQKFTCSPAKKQSDKCGGFYHSVRFGGICSCLESTCMGMAKSSCSLPVMATGNNIQTANGGGFSLSSAGW